MIPSPPGIIVSKRPSEAEVQAYLNGRLSQRSERGSNDSQISYGPITPQDELGPHAGIVTIAGMPNFGESPRKAPVPPTQAGPVSIDTTSKLSRRPSLTQSMMRTLNGRKKDTKPPPPLNVGTLSSQSPAQDCLNHALSQLVPSVPTVPARYEVAPIVHRLDRPLARRRESTTGSCVAVSPSLANTAGSSPITQSNEDRPVSRGSLGVLLRSVRKSISRRASKASPLLEAQGRMPGSKSVAGSIKSNNAPSFVNVQVETFMEIQSTPSSPAIDRKAALHLINPDSQAASIASRPRTAPAGGRKDNAFKLVMPTLSQKSTPSSSNYSSPIAAHESRSGGLQIQYSDPWKKSSAFEPAPTYSSAQKALPSPPSWLLSTEQESANHTPEKRANQGQDGVKGLAVPKKAGETLQSSAGYSSCSNASASPTSVPSWTPMMALPSPNVSIITDMTPPPVSFLDLETSPAPFETAAPSVSDLAGSSRALKLYETPKSAFLLTPGRVSMRDPWAKTSRTNDNSEDRKKWDSNHLENIARLDDAHRTSKRSPSGSELSASSGPTTGSPRPRRLSRKSVPKIDETEILASSKPDKENDGSISNKIYAGCRPFRRPSVDHQLSDMTITKYKLNTRASLNDVREALVDDTIPAVPRSQSLASRGEVILPPAPAADGEAWYNRVGRPSYPVFENTYSLRRPSYASERSSQSFPSKPTRLEFRRPSTLAQSQGMRVSFDATDDL